MTNKAMADRYRKLADYIEAQPAHNFKQNSWFCGTAACIAGHCSIMLGWKPRNDDSGSSQNGLINKGKRVSLAADVASKYLGIGPDYAYLFDDSCAWKTKSGAVKELRKRAAAIEVGYSPSELDDM